MLSARMSPWRPKPPQDFNQVMEVLSSTTMYVLHRGGPTSFTIKEDSSGEQHQVTIGSLQTCSCSRNTKPSSVELCKHIVFVMVKVLGVPKDNPLAWQLSLVDRELDDILRGDKWKPQAVPPRAACNRSKFCMARKPVQQGDLCPICYDEIHGVDILHLTWCQKGCGQNVHGKCMQVWMAHSIKTQKDLQCPMCRTNWGIFTWRAPAKRLMADRRTSAALHHVHPGTSCSECQATPISGPRYSCVSCWRLDLCHHCFVGGRHPQHGFVVSHSADSSCKPAVRDLFHVACTQACIHGQADAAIELVGSRVNEAPVHRKARPAPCRPGRQNSGRPRLIGSSPSCSGGTIDGIVGLSRHQGVAPGRPGGAWPLPVKPGSGTPSTQLQSRGRYQHGSAQQRRPEQLRGSDAALRGLNVDQEKRTDVAAAISVVGHANGRGERSVIGQALPRIKKV
eukprot:jgi/Ulvmu1/9785/UM056_0025.1